jgi:hypothetical protein
MSDKYRDSLPPHVQALHDANLKSAGQSPVRRDMQREWAEKLDYCRQFDQSKMPPWRDPRASK